MVGSLDRRARDSAVTMRGSILGHNYTDGSERDIRNGAYNYTLDNMSEGPVYGRSDVYALTGTGERYNTTPAAPAPLKQNIVRILRPHCGELSQCWLDVDFTIAPADNDLTLKIGVGQIANDGISSLQTTYSDDYIDACWRKINGSDFPLAVVNGHLTGEMLNILPALLEYGDTGWDQDIIMLILHFNKVPVAFSDTNRLMVFNLMCSAMGVL